LARDSDVDRCRKSLICLAPTKPAETCAGVPGKALATLVLAGALAAPLHTPTAEQPSGREVRCLALVAYAEAVIDGREGMAAVIRVIRNRMADPRFPDEACAVIAQVAQFQPVAHSTVLQRVVRDPPPPAPSR
jgi:hypothetical protein